jgi:hypothetical protein
MHKLKTAKRKSRNSDKRRSATTGDAVLPLDAYEAMEESLDRWHLRWLRKLLLVGDAEVRHLTENEVQSIFQMSTSALAKRKRMTE